MYLTTLQNLENFHLSLVYTSDWKAKNRVALRRDKKNRKISIHKICCAISRPKIASLSDFAFKKSLVYTILQRAQQFLFALLCSRDLESLKIFLCARNLESTELTKKITQITLDAVCYHRHLLFHQTSSKVDISGLSYNKRGIIS